tara:strand:- start:23 stop:313 length:291 start_codon:yes stop_codon:yes gene_type:complete
MNLFDYYIFLIIIVKIAYLSTIFLRNANLKKETKKKVEYYHEILHVLFYLLMAILLVIMFNPFTKEVKVSGHEKLFIFILGVLMIVDIVRKKILKK